LDWYTPVNWQDLSDNDYDLSGGPALIPGTHMLIGVDKTGDLYRVNGDAMGHLDTAATAQVFPAVSYFGLFTFALWPKTSATYLYLQQRGGPLLSYRYADGTFSTTPASSNIEVLADAPFAGFAISANGGQDGTGILWQTTGENLQTGAPGTLRAYDAGDLSKELWDSGRNAAQDSMGGFVKFVSPTVANGKVYVATATNAVAVYGLLPSIPGGGVSPAPLIAAVSNAASYDQSGVAPGEIVTLFGAGLGPDTPANLTLDSSGEVSTNLANTTVLFDGIPAPLIYASGTQTSAVVPFGITSATTQVQVQYRGQTSAPFPVNVLATAPGIISADSSGTGQALVVNQNGSLNSADSPAPPGSVLVFYATGGGQTSPAGIDGAVADAANLPAPVAPVSVQIGLKPATVLYAGAAPGMVQGVLQINVQVPADAPQGQDIPLVLQIGRQLSQPGLTVAIAN